MKFPVMLPLAVTSILFASCKKDPVIKQPVPADKTILSVKLNTAYLNGAKVDSAFATWKTNDREQRVKMLVRNDSLITEMNQFSAGNGKMAVYIYSNKKFSNQYLSHWILRKDISIQPSAGVPNNGPASFFDSNWLPRVEIKDGIGHAAIIGLRPDDSYFLVKKVQHKVIKLVVDKGYWKTIGGIQGVGQGIWECKTGCTSAEGDVENTNFFDFIPGQIGNKVWNHIEGNCFL
ncbi:MAG: hypothetical protein WDN26_04005 [Chitinophagaceae bacterium]